MTPDEREYYDERAAVMEYDGGLSREDAEKMARNEVERMRDATAGH